MPHEGRKGQVQRLWEWLTTEQDDPFASFREGFQRRPGADSFARAAIRTAANAGRALANSIRDVLSSYSGPKAFEADWKYARLVVPLQFRLLVEQELWDRRGGWRDLVTGFKPITKRK